MKAIITATAPTHYQSQSLKAFRLNKSNKSPYSSEMVAYSEFDTLQDARNYLYKLALNYYDCDKKAIKHHLSDNSLTIDAVTGYIITGSERLEFLESSNRKF